MAARGVSVLAVWLFAFLVLGEGAPVVGASPGQPEALARGPIQAAFLQAPLAFEINRGQTAAQVKYLSRGSGHTLFLTSGEVVLALGKDQQTRRDPGPPQPRTVLRMRLVGANPAPRVEGLEPLPGKANYFIGNDLTKWRANVPTYAKVNYQVVYPGVDLVYYGTNQRQLEYDFVVAPGANPKAIRLAFTGMDRLSLDGQGNLILHMAGGEVLQHAPRIYQEINGARQAVAGRYVLYGKDQVGFRVAGYDRTRPLVIDPTLSLSYATYLGGSGFDQGASIAVDGSGNAYVTGSTDSINFPTTTGAFQPTFASSTSDAFVAKLTFSGSPSVLSLSYATYLGGSGFDQGASIAVDGSGNAYVTGSTDSINFPTTTSAFQPTFGGGLDAFVTKLDFSGGLLYSTYLGGRNSDEGTSIAADSSGHAYVTGRTGSPSNDFPVAVHFVGFGGGTTDAFVAKLDSTLSGIPSLVYFTYIGGGNSDEGLGIAVDGSGNAYVTGDTNSLDFLTTTLLGPGGGTDAFVTKLDPAGSTLLYSTRLGGSGNDQGLGIAVDGFGNAYVTGSTGSTNFLTVSPLTQDSTNGVNVGAGNDAFVAKLNPAGSALVYSTYLGGSGFDQGSGIAVNATGNAYVTGFTGSTNFPPVNPLPPDSTNGVNVGAGNDAFVAKLNATGSALVYSTYLGGNNFDFGSGIAVDGSDNAYVTGLTFSSNFPPVNPLPPDSTNGVNVGFGSDAFIAKLSFSSAGGGSGDGGTFSLTVTKAGTGTVTSTPPGIDCDPTCAASFASGTMVSLTATPAAGSTFAGWGGNCNSSGQVTLDAAKTCTATFTLIPYTLTVIKADTVTVTSTPPGIDCDPTCAASFASGTVVTLTAASTGGFIFSWGGDCVTFGTALTCTLTMDAAKLVTATGESGCNMVGHVHGNQNFKATVSGKKVNVHVEVDGDCDYDKKANKVFLHHSKVHVVVDGGPPLINAKQNSNGKRDDVKSVTLSPGPPPATGTPTAIVEGIYGAIPFKVTLTDGGKRDKDDDHDKCGKDDDHDKWSKGSDDKWSKGSDGKRDKDDDHDKCGKGGDDGKGNKDDTIVVVTPVLPTPITGSAPHDDVHIDFK